MIDTAHDTQTLAAFHKNPAEILQQLRTTHRPITLTVDGKPEAILQEPAEYERLLTIVAQSELEADLTQGLEDVEQGRTRPAREIFAELRKEYGIRG